MDSKQRNFFDDLNTIYDPEEIFKQRQELRAKGEKLDYLIHYVFEQNEKGKELLSIWKEALIMQSSASMGSDSVSIGIEEGKKHFIRGILLTIQRVERGEV